MNEESEFDPAARQLCPDGACVGLIGPDGRCGECGRPGSGPAPSRGAVHLAAERDDGAGALESMEAAGPGDVEKGGGFDPGRKLCEDGTCVGVIGPDGMCQICGRGSRS
jgi:hypothetical protein